MEACRFLRQAEDTQKLPTMRSGDYVFDYYMT